MSQLFFFAAFVFLADLQICFVENVFLNVTFKY